MGVPIPHYLKDIAVLDKQKDTWTHFSLQCTCGCERFFVFENYLTKEEKGLEKPYYDALNELYTGLGASMCTRDEDGKLHHWKLYEPMKGLGGRHKEVFIPERPFFSGILAIQIKCAMCEREHVLFDSRMHGYDGMSGEKNQEIMEYRPHFRLKCKRAVSLAIKIENDASFEEFRENTALELTEEQYSDAFSWICIYKIDEKGKKTKILDLETA